MMLPPALAALAEYRAFINYKLVPGKDGKTDKLPIDPRTGRLVDAHDTRFHMLPAEAIAHATRLGVGYGIDIIEGHGIFAIDLDHCLVDGTWHPAAVAIVQRFPGAAVEISSSGDGLHVLGRFTGPPPIHGCTSKVLGFKMELYSKLRFIALTGNGMHGDIQTDCTLPLMSLIADFFEASAPDIPAEWTEEPIAEWSGPQDDDELIAKMMRSRPSIASVLGSRASLSDLWTANVDALAAAFPSQNDHSAYDGNAADQALANHLAWWTGNDCERMHRLMWKSALARDKWERERYIRVTILKACGWTTQWHKESKTPELTPSLAVAPIIPDAVVTLAPAPATTTDARPVGGYLFLDQQLEYFKGCVYVEDVNAVLAADGMVLNQPQFNARYAGHKFVTEPDGGKPTNKAWDAFVLSTLYRFPKVRGACFLPKETPNGLFDREGQRFVNSWRPIKIERIEGDVTPFLIHLKKLYPVEHDQDVILNYMRFVAQCPGEKARWALFLQGVEGNGKTFISQVMEYTVGRRYTHWPKAAQMDNRFNESIADKLLLCVEDVKITEAQGSMWETLKPMITGTRLEIEGKGTAKVMRDTCFNFVLNSNHKDGLKKTANDRRIAPLFGAQQSVLDLRRDGLTDPYHVALFKWAENGGFQAIAYYLVNTPIADALNPLLCVRAPETSSTRDAINAGLGGVEQEVLDAIQQGLPGFAGGWVSSFHLNNLIRRLGREQAIPLRKRHEMMLSLGYEWHPYLVMGQTASIVPNEGRPRLYVVEDHLARQLTHPTKIMRSYMDAQQRALTATYNDIPLPPDIGREEAK